ncbi:MAG: hypothetical protein AAGF46_11455, partial [Pseudomonadota bacterium]
PGDTTSTTVYSSGGDLVILTLEVIGVRNTETVDLTLDKSHVGDFLARQNNDYQITVTTRGPGEETNTVTVTDTLPAGLTFVSGSGAGWACAAAGQTVSCTNATRVPAVQDFPPLTLSVFTDLSALPGVTNVASVTSATFDNQGGNNATTDPTTVIDEDPALLVLKSVQTIADPVNGATNPKAIPGADVRYSITVSNTGLGPVDSGSLVVTDALPTDLALFIDATNGVPFSFTDGAAASELAFDFSANIAFTNAPGGAGPFNYTPVPDGDGYDPAITGFEVRPQGIFIGTPDPGAPTSFTLSFIARVR